MAEITTTQFKARCEPILKKHYRTYGVNRFSHSVRLYASIDDEMRTIEINESQFNLTDQELEQLILEI